MSTHADSSTQEEPLSGDVNDPEFRRRRAAKAGRAGHTPRALIDAIVRRAGQLTDEDIARLRALLPEVKGGAGDAARP